MKNISVYLDDEDYKKAVLKKGSRTWKQVLMGVEE